MKGLQLFPWTHLTTSQCLLNPFQPPEMTGHLSMYLFIYSVNANGCYFVPGLDLS